MKVKPAHRRHARGLRPYTPRRRATVPPGAPTRRLPPRPDERLGLGLRQRKVVQVVFQRVLGSWRKRGLLYRRGRRVLWVKVHADVVEACHESSRSISTHASNMTKMRLTCETGSADVLHAVVRNQKLLLPPHENGTSIGILHRQVGLLQFMANMTESRETSPVDHVFLLGRTPVPRQEAVFAADDLCVKVRRELGPVVCQATDAQIAAEVRRGEINVLQIGRIGSESGARSCSGDDIPRW